MPLINLTIPEFKRALQYFFWVSLAISVPIVLLRHVAFESSLFAAFTSVPLAVATALGLTLFVLRRPLAGPHLAKLLRRKQIHGLWFGHLTSNYGEDAGQPELHIPVAFVVRQNYLGYSIASFTAGQDGYSQLESLTQDLKTGSYVLRYVFELRRTYRGENKLTQGSGQLRLTSSDSKMTGFYWTNSPTQGQAELKLVQRDCNHIDNYADAERAFLIHRANPTATVASTEVVT